MCEKFWTQTDILTSTGKARTLPFQESHKMAASSQSSNRKGWRVALYHKSVQSFGETQGTSQNIPMFPMSLIYMAVDLLIT